MNTADEKELLKELTNCLEEQIALARRGSFAAVLQMAGRCEPLVAEIAGTGLLEKPEHKTARTFLSAKCTGKSNCTCFAYHFKGNVFPGS